MFPRPHFGGYSAASTQGPGNAFAPVPMRATPFTQNVVPHTVIAASQQPAMVAVPQHSMMAGARVMAQPPRPLMAQPPRPFMATQHPMMAQPPPPLMTAAHQPLMAPQQPLMVQSRPMNAAMQPMVAAVGPTLASPEPVRDGSMSELNLVAFVTGGNTGIGKEIARKLACAGVRTILGCQNMALGQEVVHELQAPGCDVSCTQLELCDPKSVQSARDFIANKFGRLDILVNNAAICYNSPTMYGKCEHTPFERQAGITVATNFFGTLSVIMAMLPLLRTSASPCVVTISSSAGRLAILKSPDKVAAFKSSTLTVEQIETLMKQFVSDVEGGVHESQGWGHTCYGMSKLGLIALTRVLARDEPQMTFNCADPGYCATDMNAKMGYDSPEKGARMAAFLALLPANRRKANGTIWYDGRETAW